MRNGFIAAWLALQIALPLNYYLSDDRYDERFAWRMFSPVRLAGCQVRAYDATGGAKRPIDLARDLHVVWINLMKRARLQVIEHWSGDWCAARRTEGADPVLQVDLRCDAPDVSAWAICAGGPPAAAGVPAVYARSPLCADTPEACFARECGDRDAARCFTARCQRAPLDPALNLCAPGAWDP